jgi:hypothetical protein
VSVSVSSGGVSLQIGGAGGGGGGGGGGDGVGSNVPGAPSWYHYLPPWWMSPKAKPPAPDLDKMPNTRDIVNPPDGVLPFFDPYDSILIERGARLRGRSRAAPRAAAAHA